MRQLILNPTLTENNADEIAKRIAGWADYAKIENPIEFITDVYNNLPECLAELQRRREYEIAKKATQLAFKAYKTGNYKATRSAVTRGLRHNPGILRNRGVLSIYLQSLINYHKDNE